MSIKADCHLHSSHSGDSDASMEEMIQKGIALGLTHMCFTEHNDFDFPVSEDTPQGMFELNPDAYLYDLIRLREKYAGQIRILFGVELGLQPHLMRQNAIFAKNHDYDFIIGSSHVCGGQDPYYPAFYEGRSQEEAYREYFQSVIENLKKFDNFDVYGHLDYVVRYGPEKDRGYCYETYSDLFDRILELLLEKGKGLELNTGGISDGMRDVHPCREVLRRYRQKGGEIITIGSDAHDPAEIAAHFHRAEEVLQECGFRYYTVFENRQPEFKRF
ncbi:histidinol-phosphatase [Lachnospiraceae bacterium]|nr:histidinol-phosphatase [Lachnospiraceae bacterium]